MCKTIFVIFWLGEYKHKHQIFARNTSSSILVRYRKKALVPPTHPQVVYFESREAFMTGVWVWLYIMLCIFKNKIFLVFAQYRYKIYFFIFLLLLDYVWDMKVIMEVSHLNTGSSKASLIKLLAMGAITDVENTITTYFSNVLVHAWLPCLFSTQGRKFVSFYVAQTLYTLAHYFFESGLYYKHL